MPVLDRKPYKRLTDKLREHEIRFRWEVPEGLTFMWRGKRIVIRSIEDMMDFMDDEKL